MANKIGLVFGKDVSVLKRSGLTVSQQECPDSECAECKRLIEMLKSDRPLCIFGIGRRTLMEICLQQNGLGILCPIEKRCKTMPIRLRFRDEERQRILKLERLLIVASDGVISATVTPTEQLALAAAQD